MKNILILFLALIFASYKTTSQDILSSLKGSNNQGDSLLFSIDDDPQNPVYIQGTFHVTKSRR